MADYWVSRDKYYCKYCKLFIADDKPSRTLHDTGLKHKGNYERFIREIYKRGEREAKDKAEEAREMARVELAARKAMAAGDLEAGISSSESGKTPPPELAQRLLPKSTTGASTSSSSSLSSDPFVNYSTAESLGYVDREAQLQADEAELRRKEGRIGQWEKVVKPLPPPPPPLPPHPTLSTSKYETRPSPEDIKSFAKEPSEIGDDKIAALAQEEERRPSTKRYLKEKTAALDDEDVYDPSKIGLKLKRNRLDLREMEEIREAAEKKAHLESEAKILAQRERLHNKSLNTAKSGWQEIEITDEPELQFDPLPEPKSENEGDLKEDVKPPVVDSTVLEDSSKATEGSGGFKKRKMFGAAAARRK